MSNSTDRFVDIVATRLARALLTLAAACFLWLSGVLPPTKAPLKQVLWLTVAGDLFLSANRVARNRKGA